MRDTLSTLLLRFVNILMISDTEERQRLQCYPGKNKSTKTNVPRSCWSYTELGIGGLAGQRSLMYVSGLPSVQTLCGGLFCVNLSQLETLFPQILFLA